MVQLSLQRRKQNGGLLEILGFYIAGYAFHGSVYGGCLLCIYPYGLQSDEEPGVYDAAAGNALGGFCGHRPGQYHERGPEAGGFCGILRHRAQYRRGVRGGGPDFLRGENGRLLFQNEFFLHGGVLFLHQLRYPVPV